MDGFALLDLLKRNSETQHIPVHVISANDQNRIGLSFGAYGVSGKPIERDTILATLDDAKKFGRRSKRLLVIGPASSGDALVDLIGSGDVEIENASSASQAKDDLESDDFDEQTEPEPSRGQKHKHCWRW